MTSGRSFARNSALNLAGMLLPLILAVVAIPMLVRGMGADRFGILTLAWAAIGYFGLFEFGLSRALTQAVAYRLGQRREGELPGVVWTALLMLLALGVLGAIAVAVVTPVLVTRILNVPPALRIEAITAFYILAASLPLVVTTAGLRGLMEAHQHFGAVTVLRIPLAAFMLVGPVLVLPFSRSLVASVSMLAVGRVIGLAAHVAVCARRYDYMRSGAMAMRPDEVGPLLRFGGWTTVTNLVSPMMHYLDRFLIGALLPMAAVAHYVTPYELITKVTVIASAILAATFPGFAATYSGDREVMSHLYDRALRSIVLLTFPLVFVACALAPEGMRLWMGSSWPAQSAVVLQWLAVGVFINSIAQVPFGALQGAARPDVIAKLHLLELPLYAASIWLLARSFGLQGVAIAWTLRVTVDAIALLVIAHRTLRMPLLPRFGVSWMIPLMLMAMGGAVLPMPARLRIAYVAAVGLAVVAAAWRRLLTPQERAALVQWNRAPSPVVVETTERLA